MEICSDADSFARTSRDIKRKCFQNLSSQGMGLMLMNMSLLSGNIWRLLLLSGDIEKNPGPFPKVSSKADFSFHFQIKGWLHQYLIIAQIFNREDPVAELQDDVEDQEEKIR